jgi:hypothetical protein
LVFLTNQFLESFEGDIGLAGDGQLEQLRSEFGQFVGRGEEGADSFFGDSSLL